MKPFSETTKKSENKNLHFFPLVQDPDIQVEYIYRTFKKYLLRNIYRIFKKYRLRNIYSTFKKSLFRNLFKKYI